jgi:hypothetical protein
MRSYPYSIEIPCSFCKTGKVTLTMRDPEQAEAWHSDPENALTAMCPDCHNSWNAAQDAEIERRTSWVETYLVADDDTRNQMLDAEALRRAGFHKDADGNLAVQYNGAIIPAEQLDQAGKIIEHHHEMLVCEMGPYEAEHARAAAHHCDHSEWIWSAEDGKICQICGQSC